MSRQSPSARIALTVVLVALVGCKPQEPFYLKKVDGDLAHYKGVATDIEYPDVEADRLDDVSQAKAPNSLTNKEERTIWELPLEEAIRIALTNNRVMRNIGGQVQGPPEFILRNPELAPTIYDPAIAESNPRTGPEAALSAFDAQWTTSLTWQKYDTPLNVLNSQFFNQVNVQDQSTFQTKIAKTAATGTQFALSHNITYNSFNYDNYESLKQDATDWNVNLTAELRQPLLQGAGVEFNRIAGPGATVGLYNGVVLARINTDIALASFEAGVRNLVSDVEVAYWELYFQYRSLDAVIAGRDSALSTWRKIYTLYRIGGKGGEAEKEAQAREQYYLFRKTAEQSLNALYAAEAKLRYLLGLAATDGRLIRPKDEPTTAKVVFDWAEVLNEGLARSVELRQEKWIVKRRELELIAAKNFLLPKLDMVGQYKFLGIGNRLDGDGVWDSTDARIVEPFDGNAYRSMTSGQFQEWQFGFQANVPIGFRRELSGVRNAQLILTRERVKLQEGELELSHQLAHAVRDLEANHVLSQTDFNRRVAAQREVEAVAAAYETDTITLDVLLKAQQNLAQAESDYYRALVDYNKSIAQVHFRKGSLLEYNGVYLAEGPWPGKAYFDARRRARAREASTPLNYGFTQPRVMSRGPYEQHAGSASLFGSSEKGTETAPNPVAKPQQELVPTPEPESLRPSEIPQEPAAPKPVPEPQASEQGTGSDALVEPQASDSGIGRSKDGWNAVAKMPVERNGGTQTAATARKARSNQWVDKQVTAVGWAVAEKRTGDESDVTSTATATERSAAGWKSVQR